MNVVIYIFISRSNDINYVKNYNSKYQTKEKTLYQDFDFEFPDHELFCIFGPNGSGKTTILNLLSGRMFLWTDSTDELHHPMARR